MRNAICFNHRPNGCYCNEEKGVPLFMQSCLSDNTKPGIFDDTATPLACEGYIPWQYDGVVPQAMVGERDQERASTPRSTVVVNVEVIANKLYDL